MNCENCEWCVKNKECVWKGTEENPVPPCSSEYY